MEAYPAAVRPGKGTTVERFTADHGASIRVVGRDVRLPGDEPPESATNRIRALWISTDVPATAQDLESLGLHRRLTERNGRAIDLRAAEGDILVHIDDIEPIGATVAVDTSDLDAAHQALIDIGVAHDVVDETHGRTLRVPFPGSVDKELWIGPEDPDPVGAIRHF